MQRSLVLLAALAAASAIGLAQTYGQKRMASDLADALSLIAASSAATLDDVTKCFRDLERAAPTRSDRKP